MTALHTSGIVFSTLTCFLISLCSGNGFAAESDVLANANALIRDGWWEDAQELLYESLVSDQGSPELHYLLGYSLYKTGNFKKAENHFDQAVAGDPDNSRYHHWLGAAAGRLAQTGSKFKAIGRAKKSRRSFEQARKLDPENIETAFVLMHFYLRAPGIVGGCTDKARMLAETILAQDKVYGHRAMAAILEWGDKDYDQAEQQLLLAIRQIPTDADRCLDLVDFYCRRENTSRAILVCENILAGDPEAICARYRLAALYQESGDFSRAIAELETICQKNSAERRACYEIARTLVLAQRELTRAELLLRGYLEQKINGKWPSRAEAHWQLANVYDLQGRPFAAIDELEESLAHDPKFGPARKKLAFFDTGDDFDF